MRLRDMGSIPGLPLKSNPLQYSFLENPWTEEPGRLQFTGLQSHTTQSHCTTEASQGSSQRTVRTVSSALLHYLRLLMFLPEILILASLILIFIIYWITKKKDLIQPRAGDGMERSRVLSCLQQVRSNTAKDGEEGKGQNIPCRRPLLGQRYLGWL